MTNSAPGAIGLSNDPAPSHRHFRVLLAATVAFLVVAPLASEGPLAVAAIQLLLTALMGAILFVLRGRPRKRVWTVFALGAVALLWSLGTSPSRLHACLSLSALLALQCAALAVVLRALTDERHVSIDTVLGATLGFLLIGLAFTFVYALFAIALPGSFPLGRQGAGPMPTLLVAGRAFPDLLHFSFTTLSTLGYDELTPRHPFVRSFSSLEAVIGQLYLAVLVARLVGLHLAQSLSSPPPVSDTKFSQREVTP